MKGLPLVKRQVIWLFSPYGSLPGEPWRESRFVSFGQYLADLGHEVVWWTSAFSHHSKTFRSRVDTTISVGPHFTIRLIRTTGYRSNIGFARLRSTWIYAARTYSLALRADAPDCVITGEAPIAFGYAGFAVAARAKVPVIYDQIDLWPELFVSMAPRGLKWAVKLSCLPWMLNRRHRFQNLSGVVGLSQLYLERALSIVPELRERPHAVVYNGIDLDKCRSLLIGSNLSADVVKSGEVLAIFAGGLGPSYDIECMLTAAVEARKAGAKSRLLVAGAGPLAGLVQKYAQLHPDAISYLGVLDTPSLWKFYAVCSVGIAAYKAGSNVEMPDKFYDYISAGLAVVNSLSGEVATIIRGGELGFNYTPGDSKGLCDILRSLASDLSELERMRERSRFAAQRFSMVAQCSRLGQVVDEVLSNRSGAALPATIPRCKEI